MTSLRQFATTGKERKLSIQSPSKITAGYCPVHLGMENAMAGKPHTAMAPCVARSAILKMGAKIGTQKTHVCKLQRRPQQKYQD
jgi:hypothetical protein